MYLRIATSTLVNILNISVNILIGLALTPIFIQQLGSDTYGIWVLAVSLSVTRGALGIFDLGISGSLVKYVAEYHARNEPQRMNEVFGAALIVYSVIGVLVAGGLAIFAASAGIMIFRVPADQVNTLRNLFYLLALQTLIDLPALSVFGVLEGIQRYDITRWFNIVRILIYAGSSFLFLQLGAGVYALALATLLSELIRFVGQAYWVRRLLPTLAATWRLSKSVLGSMFSLSSKLFVFSLASTVYNQMDQFIISTVLTTSLLTDYDISFRLHTLVFAFGTLIGPFVLSAASALNAANNQAELHRLWMRTTRYTAVLTVPVALITIVLAEPLTRVWIGVAYVHTVPATQLFICYLLYWALLRSGQNMLIGINRLDVLLPSFFLSTTVNLAISVFAAPRLGVAGVILGTVIGNIVTFVLYMRAFQREFGISLNDFVRWIFLSVYPQAGIGALVVAGLVASAYPANLIIIGVYGGIGVLVFGGLFVLTGMPKDERTALQNIIQTRFLARVSEKE